MLIGFLDVATRGFVAGWAADVDEPDKVQDIVLCVNGERCATIRCDRLRPDLQAMGNLGDGRHGFRYEFCPPLPRELDVWISARFAANNELLSLGERTLASELAFRTGNMAASGQNHTDGSGVHGGIAGGVDEAQGSSRQMLSASEWNNFLDAIQALTTTDEDTWRDIEPKERSTFERRLIRLALAARDGGRLDHALQALCALHRLNPLNPDTCLEILIIHLLSRQDLGAAQRFAAEIPEQCRSDNRIVLILAQIARQFGQFEDAFELIERVAPKAIADLPTFVALRRSVLIAVAFEFADRLAKVAAATPIVALAEAQTQVLEAILQFAFRDCQAPGSFQQLLEEMAFIGRYAGSRARTALCQAILNLPADTDPEIQAIGLRFLVAVRDIDRAGRFLQRSFGTELESHPGFIKAAAYLAEFTDDPQLYTYVERLADDMLQSECAKQAEPIWRYHKAPVQRLEVLGRRLAQSGWDDQKAERLGVLPRFSSRALNAEAHQHIFVGLFGQLRFPQTTLGPLRDYLRQELRPFTDADGIVSFGVSTWDRIGQRAIQTHDVIGFISQRLPEPVNKIAQSFALVRVAEFAILFPNTTARIIGDSAAGVEITAEFLRDSFDHDAFVDLSSDESFMNGTGSLLQTHSIASIPVLNQGRMWNRIAALGRLRDEAERKAGTPVTAALLVRADLVFTSGSLGTHLLKAMEAVQSDWAYVDYDPYAVYVEGLGDRYILASPAPLDRIFQAEELMKRILTPGSGVSSAYKLRFGPHEFLNTILFEQGAHVTQIPQSEVGLGLARGRFSMTELSNELAKDAEQSPNAKLRERLRNLLQTARDG